MKSIEEQLAPHVAKLHAEMRAMYGIPDMILGVSQELKEVKKGVYVGPLPEGPYRIINGYGEPVAVAAPNEGVDKERFERALIAAVSSGNVHKFLVGAGGNGGNTVARKQDPPEGKTLLSKPHPKDCICPKCPGKIAFPGAGILDVPRIGDAERDQCLERLRHAFAGGCLNPAEHDARQDAAMTATTKTELDFLVKDLPALPVKRDIAPVKQNGYRTLASALAILSAVAFPLLAAGTLLAGGPGAAAAVLCFATSLMVLAAVAVRRSA